MAVPSSGASLSDVRTEIASNTTYTTDSSAISNLNGCRLVAIPGGFTNSGYDGDRLSEFAGYTQETPFADWGNSWSVGTISSSTSQTSTIALTVNCSTKTLQKSVSPSSYASYVGLAPLSVSWASTNNGVISIVVTISSISSISSNLEIIIGAQPNYDPFSTNILTSFSPILYVNAGSGPAGPGSFYCLLYEMKVFTSDNRYVNVNEVKIGDMVKTDNGFSKVTKVITEHKREGYYTIEDGLKITSDHPFKDNNEWIVAEDYQGKKEYIDQEVNTVYIETESGEFTTFSKDETKQWTVSGNYASELV